MTRKKADDVDATRVSAGKEEPAAAGPSATQIFSQAVQEAEEDTLNRTTVDGRSSGADATGSTRIGAGADETNLLSPDSTRILERGSVAVRPETTRRSGGGGGALLWLVGGCVAGAITLVLITMFSSP